MKTKRNVCLCQVNYQYGDNVFVPYSVGSIQAYCQANTDIRNSVNFEEPIFLRENPEHVVRRMQRPAIVGFSCHLWNWEYNKRLAQMVRAAYPGTLIVFGGPQTPLRSEGFFAQHPYVDLLVHHEGELAFADILLEFLSETPNFTKIPGLSVRVDGDRSLETLPRERIGDLSKLPSPYLAGVFDFLTNRRYVLNVSQETNRGCPYRCTFCDWGNLVYGKVTPFAESRLVEEFEWFGMHRIEYLYNCDANYGILPRDHDLTVKMTEIRAKYNGYPKKFKTSTAKNSNDTIFAIMKVLNDAGMDKGATLSFQSMDENTLGIIKRKNIRIQNFSELMRKYREAGISAYTELIVGLPGETYESFKAGITTLIEAASDAVHLYVNVCAVLPNSELSDPEYVRIHAIKFARMPLLLAHSTPAPQTLPEYCDVVIETASMPQEDWRRSYIFASAVQSFHCLGLLRHIAIFFRREFGVRYADFYERLIEFFTDRPDTLVGQQFTLVSAATLESTRGGRLDVVVPRCGEICWPLEEATFLNLIVAKQAFYREVRGFIGELASRRPGTADDGLLDDLVLYQSSMTVDPFVANASIRLDHNLHEYFSTWAEPVAITRGLPSVLTIRADRDFAGDLEEYARHVVWYGRKSGRFHHSQVSTGQLA